MEPKTSVAPQERWKQQRQRKLSRVERVLVVSFEVTADGDSNRLATKITANRGTIPDEVKATTANPDNKLKGDVLLHDIISDMTLDDIQVLFEIRESLTSLPAAHTALDMSPTLLIVFYVTLLFAQLWDPPLDLDVGFSICFLLAHVM
ncbi:hypothetical protein PPTG_19228 [Phytophthora nicotianae INRA-310]|uniref:Uncharacterized protein n=3 Tax=Phytophthora nicotianae TaxID=4792 RepID=W2PDI6_PHYN3|nr:hypothetical protein PPTG_19228 [Phytophthora nicotianae INRA-310]ETI55169.1 hypothetical protein F443_02139 [Phytophthora nicotianae P1569]ETM98896.1 hypothetical protein PPTG_19228 [Phytophthora nicotianae INRA-310]ETO62098.1 hypothetical protein F444_19968 [Phytophthora nicotianae P1976]